MTPAATVPVTAILLAYRHASSIAGAIDSLLGQTVQAAEIIISDDASDDGTFEAARRHLESVALPHTAVTLRRNPENLGLIGHLDLLVQLAQHELIVFFAGDDISVPERIEKTFAVWQQMGSPPRCLIHGNVQTIDETPRQVLRPPVTTLRLSLAQTAFASSLHIGATESFTRDLWLGWPVVTEPGVFEDLVLGFRAALAGRYVHIDETLVQYRLHGGLGDPARHRPLAQRLLATARLLRQRQKDLAHFLAAQPESRESESITTLLATLDATLTSKVFEPGTETTTARRRASGAPTGAAAGPYRGTPLVSVIVPVEAASRGWLEMALPMLHQQRYPHLEWLLVPDHDSALAEERVRQALPGTLRFLPLRRRRSTAGLIEAGIRCARGEWLLVLPPNLIPAPEAIASLLAHAEINQADWTASRPSLTLGGLFAQDFQPEDDSDGSVSWPGLTLYRRRLAACRPRWWTCSSAAHYLAQWQYAIRTHSPARRAVLDARLAVAAAGPLPPPGLLHDLLQPYARRSVPLTDKDGDCDPLAEPPSYGEWLAELYRIRTAEGGRTSASGRQWAVILDARTGNDKELAQSLASLMRQQIGALRTFVLDDPARVSANGQSSPQISHYRDEDALEEALRLFAAEDAPLWWLFLQAGDLLTPDACSRLEACLSDPKHDTARLVYFDHDELGPDGRLQAPHFKPAANPALLRSMFYPGRALAVRSDWLHALGLRPGALPQHLLYRLCLRTFETEPDYLVAHCAGIIAHLNGRLPPVMAADEKAWSRLAEELAAHATRMDIDAEIGPGPAPGTFHFIPPLVRTPRVSILIPTREQLSLLQRCLESLLDKTDYPDFEIVVIDNGSTSSSCLSYLQALERLAPGQLRVIYAPGPFNFSRLCNLAARQATGEFLLLLNNDTAALQPDWLRHLMRYALCDDSAAVGARLVFPNGAVQHAGIVVGLRGAADHPFLGDPLTDPGYQFRAQLTQNYSAVTAACLLVRKEFYEVVGGLDEDAFAVSFNDVDFCLRLGRTGKRIVWTPLATLLHEGSASQRAQVESGDFSTKRLRFGDEQRAFAARWPAHVANDPAYNPHLSLVSKGFEIETNVHAIARPPAPADRPRIVGLPADRHGSGHYRVLQPLHALVDAGLAEGGISHEYLPAHLVRRGEIDALILQRPHTDHQLDILESCAALRRAALIYEIDDLADQIPATSAHRVGMPADMRARIERAASLCDRLVVSTEALAEALAGLNADIRVVPNRLPPRLWGEVPPRRHDLAMRSARRPRVGWAGGIGHRGDLLLIEEVIRSLADEVEWEFFGMCPESLRPYVRRHVPGVPIEFYPARLKSIAADWDLAIAPLEDNRFNACKSNLRLLEYGWCGVPVVCSDLQPYRGPLTATRVANDAASWRDAIRTHLHDRIASRAAGLALQREVAENHILTGASLHAWLAAWRA